MEPSSTWGQGKQELIRVELGLMVQGSEVMLCWGMQDRFLVEPSGQHKWVGVASGLSSTGRMATT